MPTAKEFLRYAKDHLKRVQDAWIAPTDWTDLTIYGFYCLEAAVMSASEYNGVHVPPNHPAKAAAAKNLAGRYGIPDVSTLLSTLNTARKAAAYGDTPFPNLDAEQLAIDIENYVDAVETLVGS